MNACTHTYTGVAGFIPGGTSQRGDDRGGRGEQGKKGEREKEGTITAGMQESSDDMSACRELSICP